MTANLDNHFLRSLTPEQYVYINENSFDMVWYDFSETDYTWAKQAMQDLNRFNFIIQQEINNVNKIIS